MTDDHFRQVAAQRRWSSHTQVEMLLEYIGHQDCDDAFHDFLGEKAGELGEATEDFLWDVADHLQHRRLLLDADFQLFCADVFDLFTPEEAAFVWRQRRTS